MFLKNVYKTNKSFKNDEQMISKYLDELLLRLNFKTTYIGCFYFKEAIMLAYFNKTIYFRLNILLNELSIILNNLPYAKIKSNLNILFQNSNLLDSSETFEDIFKIPFSFGFLTPKNYIRLFVKHLNYKFNNPINSDDLYNNKIVI